MPHQFGPCYGVSDGDIDDSWVRAYPWVTTASLVLNSYRQHDHVFLEQHGEQRDLLMSR